MILHDKEKIVSIKKALIRLLKENNALWSYAPESVNHNTVKDDQLIALTMRYLDLDEIALLFQLYPFRMIKDAWVRLLVPEGEYLYTLNRFFAWYYFKAKRPDTYLKSLQTRHLNKIIHQSR